MIKLAHFITKSEVGGAQTWVKDQITLCSHDYDQYLVTNKPGWLTENISDCDFFFSKGIEKKFSLATLYKLVNFVKRNNIEVIVASSANAGVYARLIKLFHRCRVIYVSHGWSCIYNGGRFKKIFIFIERILSHLTDVVLCVSNKDKKDALDIIKVAEEKTVHIRNSVFSYPACANRFPEQERLFRILFLGRLSHPKRPDILIEALNDIERVHVDVVGDGPLKYKLKESNKVSLLGEISNFKGFDKYDLFVLISDSEGMPMSALEAASAGVPILLSNVGGCPEIVSNNGLLVENNSQSVAEAIKTIKNDYVKFKKGALNCRSEYDIINSYERYKEIYSH